MKKSQWLYGLGLLAAFVVGLMLRGGKSNKAQGSRSAAAEVSQTAPSFYTCSMHPQIQLPKPGRCPLCPMDLIPVSSAADESQTQDLVLSKRAMKLADVVTARVERRFVTAEVPMVGKVAYDETRISTITAWVPGRLDRLYVDYTGVSVREGDHLVDLYSPDLVQAQEELLSAKLTEAKMREGRSEVLKLRAANSVASAREKLRLWGLSEEQIQEIEAQKEPSDHITINSPISGVVVKKNAVEGRYVQTGTEVYTVADLSSVWVKLEAYESDLPWLHYGQEVEFRTEAYPGEVFKGLIAFIDPVLNPVTRTIKIRVNLPNKDGKLKPDMFVRAVVKSQVARGGRVMDAGLTGKWISPMHPEIVKDTPGECDICGMDLVSAESLGYVSAEQRAAPLVIPASAPLMTGKRAVVYVAKGEGRFEGREIELGVRAGDFYLVESGLEEGERVVARGNFKIDSAIQILAKPSMMNPRESDRQKQAYVAVPEAFRRGFEGLITDSLQIQKNFSKDSYAGAQTSIRALSNTFDKMDFSSFSGDSKEVIDNWERSIFASLESMKMSEDLASARVAFDSLSQALIEGLTVLGWHGRDDLFVYHCPMAFGNKGADWLQASKGTENPYYGSEMFSCGRLASTIHSLRSEGDMRTSGSHQGHDHD